MHGRNTSAGNRAGKEPSVQWPEFHVQKNLNQQARYGAMEPAEAWRICSEKVYN